MRFVYVTAFMLDLAGGSVRPVPHASEHRHHQQHA